ncbi:glycosyltransferase family 2 protein [Octadecabacter sp. CECT 8868]|uniref:glycosyltransferase n=1 Tax=Octadecabacter algicola TaxID=2909342 RepID=UPI001F36A582|nr:glycosyltransferase family 2 protein [Octadecabacter algicola]MCF2906661.1 glycosyltransferase family 2 protein [Octadecabacter algicola]
MTLVPATVAVVIVNYRTPDLVIDCLASLQGEVAPDLTLKICVGDAQSGDGSVELITQAVEKAGYDNVTVYDIGANGGFAYGNNHVVETCVAPDPTITHVHFLNPDTYIHPGAVRHLVTFLDGHPGVGVAGSRLENPDRTLRAYAFRFPAPWREFFRGAGLSVFDRLAPSAAISHGPITTTREVDWVTGASFMMPRATLDDVGEMDPDFFLYFEEVEFQSRVRAAGHTIWHVTDSRVVHIAGAATGVRVNDAPKRLPAYWYQSRFRYFLKRYSWGGAVLANILYIMGYGIYRLHRALRRKPVLTPPHTARDILSSGFGAGPTAKQRGVS